jgi:hypothetical protein
MKKIILLLLTSVSLCLQALADEGMWLPQLLQALNEKDMKKMGLKIGAADIYSINKASLKDAIVSFGGFCTAEVISNEGLLLTNHHCGFDAIQDHSTLQRNYIRDGFWAYNKDQELPNPTLFATFIVRIDEVTKEVLAGVTPGMTERERQAAIDRNIAALRPTVQKESYQDIVIRPFFESNKYYLFVTETYKDVRLVGAPPASIGNFGKDTDNWMWPRHTGDFSLFRIYAGKDGKPAAYSPDNVPYKPKRSLTISLKGVKEGDFTMVFGFPGRTNQYLHSRAAQQIQDVLNPAKINIRDKALKIMDGFMRRDERIKIQYADKYASIENAYKKWKGEVLGLRSKNAVGRKKAQEAAFAKIVLAKPEMNMAYVNLLNDLEKANTDIEYYARARDYFNEAVGRLELLSFAFQLNTLAAAVQKPNVDLVASKNKLLATLEKSYKDFSPVVDQQMTANLLELYVKDQDAAIVSPYLRELLQQHKGDYSAMTAAIFAQSPLANWDNFRSWLSGVSSGDLAAVTQQDMACRLIADIQKTYNENIGPKLNEYQATINRLQRTYMQAQLDVFSDKVFYPDANGTLRLTYGQVKKSRPRDGMQYEIYTYLDGVMEKYKPGDYEFDVPQKLIDLYNKKDFGPYGTNGRQTVCFIAANHTTGGNSGSPALDANGNLIGLNFDRAWEGTMSDINYDPSICRNIMVDIRYVLFIVDKFAGAGNLIKEMKIIR